MSAAQAAFRLRSLREEWRRSKLNVNRVGGSEYYDHVIAGLSMAIGVVEEVAAKDGKAEIAQAIPPNSDANYVHLVCAVREALRRLDRQSYRQVRQCLERAAARIGDRKAFPS